jgi:putative ATP-dependent endonuclease of the OLD family
MKVLQLVIHNFRGIFNSTIDLCDYTLLVGPNNAGKSTVVDAIRAFYEKDGFKFKPEEDFPFASTTDKESWVEIMFALSSEEYDSLANTYKTPNRQLRLRKYFQTINKMQDGKSATGSIFGYKADGSLSSDSFYGAKNVQSGKIGDIVYIPAVSKVDEHTKLSGPSALRDLLTNVLQDVVEASAAFNQFNKDFASFAAGIKNEKTEDGRSLNGLEEELNRLLGSWDIEFKLKLVAPSTPDIIKSMVGYDLFDKVHGKAQGADQFGSGFQRHFIYSLIQIGARYVGKKPKKKSRDFTPSMTLILFEEPEAYLHPPQQEILARSLISLSCTADRQVICSTHSAHFVSKNAANIPSIVRMKRNNTHVTAFQISKEAWDQIVHANQAINEIAKRWPDMAKRLETDDLRPEMEAVKNFLWLNPDRCGLFFANHVLLVEGQAEQALINRLAGDGKIPEAQQGIYVLDCLGKYNIHRFINLLKALGVPHSVVHDDDLDEDQHKELNELIAASKDPQLTFAVKTVPGNIEKFLDVSSCGSPHRKPQHLLFLYEKGEIKESKLKNFCDLIGESLPKTG